MMSFEEWLRTVYFQKPTKEAYELAECAWKAALKVQVELCAKAVSGCELVAPNVRRVRLDEAVGACMSALHTESK
jgi:hypothetical protein